MIDINFHLITASGDAPPSDDHASFTRLAEPKILKPQFARRMTRAADLRNRLVHEYDEIDAARVFEALRSAMDDVPAYLGAIDAHVGSGGPT